MLRRFNYTGRERIKREDVSIALTNAKPLREFDLRLALTEYKLAPEAKVFVEAYEKTALMRFDCGTVGEVKVPGDRKLTVFEGSEVVLFRIKVVDTGQKTILAEADSIIPLLPSESEEKRTPLLPIRGEQLGQRVWEVEFHAGSQDPPTLLINNRISDRTALVRSPEFMALALPAVFREILTRILILEDYAEMEDNEDWKCKWLRVGKQLLQPQLDPPTTSEDRPEWINRVVEAFCNRHLVFDRLVSTGKKEEA